MDVTYGDSVILGLIQGLTEFLPVSSSGHLVLAKNILSVPDMPLTFDIFFHFATLLAVVTLFRGDIVRMIAAFFRGIFTFSRGGLRSAYTQDRDFRLAVFVIAGTAPAACAGFLFRGAITAFFTNPHAVSGFLVVTGLILISTRWSPRSSSDISAGRALLIGCGQALALLPGVSRSGTTIAAALWTGVEPEQAVKFSFFLAIPAILGATAAEALSLPPDVLKSELFLLITGGITAYVSGLLAIILLIRIVMRGRFFWFGVYCIAVGILTYGIL